MCINNDIDNVELSRYTLDELWAQQTSIESNACEAMILSKLDSCECLHRKMHLHSEMNRLHVDVFYHRLVRSRSHSSSQWHSYQNIGIYTGSNCRSVIEYWKLKDQVCSGWLQAWERRDLGSCHCIVAHRIIPPQGGLPICCGMAYPLLRRPLARLVITRHAYLWPYYPLIMV
jgi:hypothetical protein